MDWQFMPLQCMQIALLCSAIVSRVQKLYLKTIHSNTNNTSSIELLNRLSDKHKIVTENMLDSTYNTARHI
jgi:hypothetical protein